MSKPIERMEQTDWGENTRLSLLLHWVQCEIWNIFSISNFFFGENNAIWDKMELRELRQFFQIKRGCILFSWSF